jgi:hypothetical protein
MIGKEFGHMQEFGHMDMSYIKLKYVQGNITLCQNFRFPSLHGTGPLESSYMDITKPYFYEN